MPTRNPGYNLKGNMEEGKRADEVGVSEGVPQLILIYDHLPRCSISVLYHTTVPQRIRHKDPYATAEHERLEECATLSAANHDLTSCRRKAPLYAGQSVSVINNNRTLWLPATVVHTDNHGSYMSHFSYSCKTE